AGHCHAGFVVVGCAIESEAVATVETAKVQRGRETAPAENHINLAAKDTAPGGAGGAHEHIVEAVAVDVASSGHRKAGEVVVGGAVEGETVATVETAEVQHSRKAAAAEDHVHLAALGDAPDRVGGAHEKVVEAVAVDIASASHRLAGEVVVSDA